MYRKGNKWTKQKRRIVIITVVLVSFSVLTLVTSRSASSIEIIFKDTIANLEYYIIKAPIQYVTGLFEEYNDLKDVYEENAKLKEQLDNLARESAMNEVLTNELNDLKERNLSNISTSKEMESLQRTITELQNIEIQLRKVLSEAILGLKNKINEAVKKNTEQEMAFIRENVTKMPKGTKTAHSILDGNLILEKDAEYYDNLYILSKIIDNVKDDLPLINVGDVIWVNPEQLDSAKELVNKIDFLKLVKKEELADIQKEKPNNKKLIENINAELDRLRPTIDTAEKDKKEYDNLMKYYHL